MLSFMVTGMLYPTSSVILGSLCPKIQESLLTNAFIERRLPVINQVSLIRNESGI